MILKILLLILLIASSCFAQEWREARMLQAIVGGQKAGLTCGTTPVISCPNQNMTGEISWDTWAQLVNSATSIQVCKVKVYTAGGTASLHVEFWTDNVKAGSQIGGDSSVVSGVNGGLTTFTWSSNYPTFSGNAYLHPTLENINDTLYIGIYNADPGGTLYKNGTQQPYWSLTFEIYILE